jgi:hypothetical protein
MTADERQLLLTTAHALLSRFGVNPLRKVPAEHLADLQAALRAVDDPRHAVDEPVIVSSEPVKD